MARAFPPATKERADEMVENLRQTIGARLADLDWMGEATRKAALAKLSTFVAKIGYPDEWRDYSRLHVSRAGYLAVDDLHVNGKLTLGENIGDFSGVTMAYHAFEAATAGQEPKKIDGFTPDQRFFLAWAQSWRRNQRPENVRLQVNTNPHAPSRFRAVGPLSNIPEFAAAFGCKEGDPMVRPAAERAVIW